MVGGVEEDQRLPRGPGRHVLRRGHAVHRGLEAAPRPSLHDLADVHGARVRHRLHRPPPLLGHVQHLEARGAGRLRRVVVGDDREGRDVAVRREDVRALAELEGVGVQGGDVLVR